MINESPYITWEEFNAAVKLICSPDKECNSLGKELLKFYRISCTGDINIQMSYTANIKIFGCRDDIIIGSLYTYNKKHAIGHLKDLYDEWIEWETKQPIH